jgi:uncharacterized protein YjiS (DUF1127 family)
MEVAMSFYSDAQTPSLGAWLVQSVTGYLGNGLRSALQTLKNRRDATILAGMDEHMLADIGLTRGDVRDAFSEPVWRDPTTILVSRAHERRVNRRRLKIGLVEKSFDAPSIVPSVPSGKAARLPAAWRAY